VRTRRRITILAVLLTIAIIFFSFPFWLNKYLLSVLIIICITLLPTISTRISLLAGQINIAVVGFFAIGGYASGYLAIHYGVPFLAAFLAGGIIPAIASLLLGLIIINLGDLYFLIITWGFLELVRSVAIKMTPITFIPSLPYRVFTAGLNLEEHRPGTQPVRGSRDKRV